MPRGGLMFVRCAPAANTAQAVCVLLILVASSLSSLQSVLASRIPLSRDLRGDNNVRFGLADDKAASPGGAASGASASTVPKAPPAAKAGSEKTATPAPAPSPTEKKEATIPASPPAKGEPAKPEASKPGEETGKKTDAGTTTGTPAAAPAPATPPAGQQEGAGGGKEKAASGAGGGPAASSGQAQDQPQGPGPVTPRAGEISSTNDGSSGSTVSGTTQTPPTTGGNKTDAAQSLRAPISATLALVLSGCALTIL